MAHAGQVPLFWFNAKGSALLCNRVENVSLSLRGANVHVVLCLLNRLRLNKSLAHGACVLCREPALDGPSSKIAAKTAKNLHPSVLHPHRGRPCRVHAKICPECALCRTPRKFEPTPTRESAGGDPLGPDAALLRGWLHGRRDRGDKERRRRSCAAAWVRSENVIRLAKR
jgi:hypothetical protein